DGPADAVVDRVHAVSVGEGAARLLDCPAVRVDQHAVAEVDLAEGELRTVRGMRAQVSLERVVRVGGGLSGRHAAAEHDGHLRRERIARRFDGGEVDAGDGDGRLVPDPTENRAVADRAYAVTEPGLGSQLFLRIRRRVRLAGL